MPFLSLPNEMIEMIFKKLNNLNEILKCRLVSKRCKQVVNGIRITSLRVNIVNESQFSILNLQGGQLTKELIGSMSVLFKAESPNFLYRELMKQMLSRLRKLAISSVANRNFWRFQANINQLNDLEHLVIVTVEARNSICLRFDHIRTFAILHHFSAHITLTAPRLTKLILKTSPSKLGSKLKLVKPNELTHLIVSCEGWRALSNNYHKDKIEYVSLDSVSLRETKEIIRTHPALRELHIQLMKAIDVREIVKQKKVSRNLDLIIYLHGLPIKDFEDIKLLFGDQIWVGKSVRPSYVIANFEQIRSINRVLSINYSELLRHRLSVDAFVSKFVHIEQVTVGETLDSAASFIGFLKKCKKLKELTITNSSPNQEFYDALPTVCAGLETLKIELVHQIDLEFFWLLKYSQLKKFTINQEINLALVDRLIRLKPHRYLELRFQLKRTDFHLFLDYSTLKFEFAGNLFTYSNNSNQTLSLAKAITDLRNLV